MKTINVAVQPHAGVLAENFVEDSSDFLRRCGSEIHLGKGENLILENDPIDHVFLIEQGWACGYKLLVDGTMQTLHFFMPGDLCNLSTFMLLKSPMSVRALGPVIARKIPLTEMTHAADTLPDTRQFVREQEVLRKRMSHQWLVNLVSLQADQRLAHLLCEIVYRRHGAAAATRSSFNVPLTQIELAEALGISIVHMNRVVRQLRKEGMLDLRQGSLTVADWQNLVKFACFDAGYLKIATH
ncbi:Crp/Fnr family transcriptional regulator [Marinobacter nanhaiticus D15-8W]|uniref:Crp/Fnr family transcriptional regulator n=1 Tax=Marinobacter nanhaiticus D15-8W TaxID=626887 RepID=N6WMV5_9GAMM|nr:Crp/Fnr family transcriptional regulator [Marinobacter nanhaiticus]ENO12801.1 Crp/Fnr family transcriptional regulator [Marinobacter nanhaiticus D15-8W]BES70149.1 Crp/Fnr family transcriptional regulator [Marinobacter nanhaiticus D15-8W]